MDRKWTTNGPVVDQDWITSVHFWTGPTSGPLRSTSETRPTGALWPFQINHLNRTPDATPLPDTGTRDISNTPCVHIKPPSQLADPILMEYHL